MPFHNDDDVKEDELDDEEATLADDLLDEVGADEEESAADDMEGFGLITEDVAKEKEEEDDDEDKAEEETSIEDDAEDVDFDTFDDVDEM